MTGEAAETAEVGARLETAAIPGGLLRRKDTGRHAHRHEGGLVAEDKGGTIVLPYAVTQVFTIEPVAPDADHRRKGRAEWTFERRGASWATGSIDRASPLAVLCRAATQASAEVRLAIFRERLAGGDTVDFVTAAANAHELWVHGHRPMPWSEATGIEDRGIEGVLLHTATRGDFTLAHTATQVADLAVLIALVERGR